jgi:hypothetical protein
LPELVRLSYAGDVEQNLRASDRHENQSNHLDIAVGGIVPEVPWEESNG